MNILAIIGIVLGSFLILGVLFFIVCSCIISRKCARAEEALDNRFKELE